MRILLIEDDELVAKALAKALAGQHYAIDLATDGQAGWELLVACKYDLILLDVMLPKLDGITLCRRLRSQGDRTPIILVTAKDNSTSKVHGLDAGADDYITKPVDLAELSARIRALLRRGDFAAPPVLEWGDLRLDPSICKVSYSNQPIDLTPKEYGLLELFLRNRHRVFSCGVILDRLWSYDEETPSEDTVRSHIKGLRMKLRAAGVLDDPVETVYGIGYRLKSAEQTKAKNTSKVRKKAARLSPEQEQQTLTGVARVWERVKEKFIRRVATIEQAIALLQQRSLDEQLRHQAEQEAHKLAGSLGMYGFALGSRLARQIENLLQAGVSIAPEQARQLSELVAALHRELQRSTVQTPELQSIDESPWLLIVEPDRSLSEGLVMEATSRGMRGEIATDLVAIEERLKARSRPDAVLLDFSADTAQAGVKLLTELNAFTPPVPALILTDRDSLLDRVTVARLGGRGFLHKFLPPARVLDAVTQMLQRCRTATARILAVDDDPQVLQALHALLEPWGIKLSTVNNPMQFWDTLEAVAPDLLILDVEMPQISGIELCQVARNDPRWSGLPILFLTAHADAETMQRIFAAGADDYVNKPIVGPELIGRILNRLERSRLLQNLAQTDALTKVANRRQSTQELSQLLRLAQLHDRPLCFAILDLDRLKQINDRYGHAVGDEILSRLGELLRRTFQSEDVVGRWGGAEFVVGMYGMTASDGVRRLVEVLVNLRQQQFTVPDREQLTVTFSAGVVQYPQDGSDLQALYQAAGIVLQQAKIAGGDRVLSC
ncbi:response regulator [Scytonema millei]|uniref:Response regulator n=1 Tax=Scytonema millei VB511283 TaxID=1245923 RepID=A0A9X5I5B3_9CYAN|nr:response regulator [Scytonema millei]NHC35821.1 response regulator [Scytonema millei VB511283]